MNNETWLLTFIWCWDFHIITHISTL